MLDNLQKHVDNLRLAVQTACLGQPVRPSFQVVDNHFVFKIGGDPENWPTLCDIVKVPPFATRTEQDGQLTCRWVSHADVIFGAGGILAGMLPGYETRESQLYGARLLQRSIEMGETAVIEAGTGVGKSLMYLLIARAMGVKIIVSTSNRMLQMQLYRKDAPFVASIFPIKYALIQGKSNFACQDRAQGLGEINKVSKELADWYWSTETGNTQEIDFVIDHKELAQITVNENCTMRSCGFYAECFYRRNRDQAREADIIICNHALLALHRRYERAHILPSAGVIVIDEAHQFQSYVARVWGEEVKMAGVKQMVDTIRKYDTNMLEIDPHHSRFEDEIFAFGTDTKDTEIAIKTERILKHGQALALAVHGQIKNVWDLSVKPETKEDRKKYNAARRLSSQADKLLMVSKPTRPGYVRWLNRTEKCLYNLPLDVSEIIGAMCGFRKVEAPNKDNCALCNKPLEVNVAVLNGSGFHPECVTTVDPFCDTEIVHFDEWTEQEEPAIIDNGSNIVFTSATLGTPDLTPFMREHGIAHALQAQLKSPFPYRENSLLYLPDGNAPTVKAPEFLDYMVEQMSLLVNASKGGAFLLFTSNRALAYAVEKLRRQFERIGYPCYVQGDGYTKMEIVNRMKECGNGVLFATKSFFEGADIQGDALRMVVIDKMPFLAPSPFSQAQDEHLRAWARANLNLDASGLEYYPFNAKRIPEMIIDLKQAHGRLIRSMKDRGVVAILDNRTSTTRYGRMQVIASLPDSKQVRSIEAVREFFEDSDIDTTPIASLSSMELAEHLYGDIPF